MHIPDRRIFLLQLAVGSTMLSTDAGAQPLPKLDEADPQALALGYKHDTTKVDPKKYPKHTAAQKCGGCQLYQAKPAEPWGPCPLFAGKQVATTGWCSAWVGRPA